MAPEIDYLKFTKEQRDAFRDWRADKECQGKLKLVKEAIQDISRLRVFLVDDEPVVFYEDNYLQLKAAKIYCGAKIAEELESAGIIQTEAEVTQEPR